MRSIRGTVRVMRTPIFHGRRRGSAGDRTGPAIVGPRRNGPMVAMVWPAVSDRRFGREAAADPALEREVAVTFQDEGVAPDDLCDQQIAVRVVTGNDLLAVMLGRFKGRLEGKGAERLPDRARVDPRAVQLTVVAGDGHSAVAQRYRWHAGSHGTLEQAVEADRDTARRQLRPPLRLARGATRRADRSIAQSFAPPSASLSCRYTGRLEPRAGDEAWVVAQAYVEFEADGRSQTWVSDQRHGEAVQRGPDTAAQISRLAREAWDEDRDGLRADLGIARHNEVARLLLGVAWPLD